MLLILVKKVRVELLSNKRPVRLFGNLVEN